MLKGFVGQLSSIDWSLLSLSMSIIMSKFLNNLCQDKINAKLNSEHALKCSFSR